jgi:DNA-binding transcriptional MerR regulator
VLRPLLSDNLKRKLLSGCPEPQGALMATTYKIGEAAALLNLKTYVLRFWETEFPEFVPLRTEKGQRLYTEAHLALLERIRYLLHERGLTIGGARKALAEEKARGVVYVFGTPAAMPGGAAQDGLVLDPVEESEDAASDEEQDFDALEPDAVLAPILRDVPVSAARDDLQAGLLASPAISSLRQAGAKQRPQYNLPGLDQIVALREAIAVEKPEPAPEGGAEPQPAEGLGTERPDQGMLPLFTMVRAAFLAGKAAGTALPGKGGDNFIQTGADGAETAALGPAGAFVPAPETLRLLVEELEQVARILRADTPAEPEAGEHSPRIISREHTP